MIQLGAQEFALRRAGRVAQAVLVLGIAASPLGVMKDPGKGAMLVCTLVSGTAIFSGVGFITSSVGF